VQDHGNLQLLSGHGFAIWVALFSHALYLLLGYRWFFSQPDKVIAPKAPTLVCLLLLIALLSWVVGAAAFFFDGFRTPIILPWAVLVIAAAQWPESDHFFDVQVLKRSPEALYPYDVLNSLASSSSHDHNAIIVYASGGGIQAAAWTAKVLTALRQDIGPDFTRSLKLISSVSGGSAGALQFLGAWQKGDVPAEKLEYVLKAAEDPVIDEVAQGLIYPDLWRLAFPFFVPHESGRGQAMEREWKRRAKFPKSMSELRA
jgi:hypothetical protein